MGLFFRKALLTFGGIGLFFAAYSLWSPGVVVTDGRHDLRSNGIWLQHGWLGEDGWFSSYKKDKAAFRNWERIDELFDLLSQHGIVYLFPHLCPTDPSGQLSDVDHAQTELFLTYTGDFKVMPWVGGILGKHCFPASKAWRSSFIHSITALFEKHPRFAGIHINIEPMPNGNKDFIILLKELRRALPKDKIISIAAYPPSTILHPFPEVHWDRDYFKQVSSSVDQIAVMMYDTSLPLEKVYQSLMASWTREVLLWAGDKKILLGVPAYDDAGAGYHIPRVENLNNSLSGIHAGLNKYPVLPPNYQGISIYCEWKMDQDKWAFLRANFLKNAPRNLSLKDNL